MDQFNSGKDRGEHEDPAALPLSNHRLYDGKDVDDAREVLSELFTEIALDPLELGQPFRAQVNAVELPRIGICYLRFENGAIAGPLQALDFHTLQLNLTGSSVYNTDDGATGGDASHGVMLSAGQTVLNRHSMKNGHLALNVKDEVMRNHLARYTGKNITTELKFAADFDLTQPRIASILAFTQTFIQELNRPGGILESPAAIASYEDFLLTFLLQGMEHNLRDQLEIQMAAPALDCVCKLEDYMSAHASEPLHMEKLVDVSGVSGATIHRAFRKYRGYTPMQFLQDQRMRFARQRLLSCYPAESVSRIAMECGFVHMGRFAAEYRRRFNENPSQTVKRREAKIGRRG